MSPWPRCRVWNGAPLAAAFACLALTTAAAGQQRPMLLLTMAHPDSVYVSIKGLLNDRVISAMESGFPLYVEYRVVLRESRGLFDRTVDVWDFSMVVVHDPVRDVLFIEEPGVTTELSSRGALRLWLEKVYLVPTRPPDRPGRYYYEATVDARTLSDSDVDEAFAWLRGESGDSARLRKPGVITRTARKLLVQVAPLPRISLKKKTPEFERN